MWLASEWQSLRRALAGMVILTVSRVTPGVTAAGVSPSRGCRFHRRQLLAVLIHGTQDAVDPSE